MKMAAATAVITATAITTTVNTKYMNNYNSNNSNNSSNSCNNSNKCKSSNIKLQQGHKQKYMKQVLCRNWYNTHVLSNVCERSTAAPWLSSAVFIAQKILIQLIPNRFRGQVETGCSLSVNFSYKHFGPVRQQR